MVLPLIQPVFLGRHSTIESGNVSIIHWLSENFLEYDWLPEYQHDRCYYRHLADECIVNKAAEDTENKKRKGVACSVLSLDDIGTMSDNSDCKY